MNDLEVRLQRALTSRASRLPVGDPPDRAIPLRSRPEPGHSRRRTLAAVAATLLLLAGALTAVWVRDHRGTPSPADRLRRELAGVDPIYATTIEMGDTIGIRGGLSRIDPGTGAATPSRLSMMDSLRRSRGLGRALSPSSGPVTSQHAELLSSRS